MWSTTGSHANALQVAVFGKQPRSGDFLRVGSGGPAGEALEQFVEQGLAHAEGKRGSGWPAQYTAGATYAFVFRPPRSTSVRDALVGVIKPSGDSVGRRFPLVVYAPTIPRSNAPWPHVLPIALGDFLDAAANLLIQADSMTGIGDMQAALRHVAYPNLSAGDQAAQEYDAWASATLLTQAWSVVYGGEVTSAARAMHTITEAIASFRGVEGPATKLGLRLPLGPGGIAAATSGSTRTAVSPAPPTRCAPASGASTGRAAAQSSSSGIPRPAPSPSSGRPTPTATTLDLTVPASVDVKLRRS